MRIKAIERSATLCSVPSTSQGAGWAAGTARRASGKALTEPGRPGSDKEVPLSLQDSQPGAAEGCRRS